ncbi:hypothetical protein NDU88_002292 [Pleurodeles waltl]|uniref:Uncharacterized protein n=1 Tax=Pleurodeles waltl TaxID=8319 RepID=A0AAV7T2E8_PLEWA|nr:hypothetical protein NDU88_002292 [Pleurodeles waltl]
MVTPQSSQMTGQPDELTDRVPHNTMERILQEIMAVNCRLEGTHFNISTLTAETKSIRIDIVGLQNCIASLELCVTLAKDRHNTLPDWDQEPLYFHSKVINLEARSRSNNVLF